jgi:hypothetical protein
VLLTPAALALYQEEGLRERREADHPEVGHHHADREGARPVERAARGAGHRAPRARPWKATSAANRRSRSRWISDEPITNAPDSLRKGTPLGWLFLGLDTSSRTSDDVQIRQLLVLETVTPSPAILRF